MDLEGLSRLGFDPFSINVGYILLEERWVIQLPERISICRKTPRMVTKAVRTRGMV